MKRFEELLAAYWYACEVYVRASCSDYTADELDSYHVATVAARGALVEYVRERMDMPDELIARIERQRVRFEAEHDMPMTFADAVRTLIDVALIGEEERDDD